MKAKPILLVCAILIISVAIWYLESNKPNIAPAKSLTAQATTTSDRSEVISRKGEELRQGVEISDPTGFLNAGSFKLADITGNKIILIDFWTYSCINCIRTFPYLNAWYEKYKDYGLVIVGVHTPEFDFEKDFDNVSTAVKKFGIEYPIVLDSNRGTWNAYRNQYWPNKYLIDIDGFIAYQHAGEGNYTEAESEIQSALKERTQALGLNIQIPGGTVEPLTTRIDFAQVRSPETYFGSSRNEYLGNGVRGVSGAQKFSIPKSTSPNTLYLVGTWDLREEYAENQGEAKILFKYSAKNVYLVASSVNGARIKVLLDGKPPGSVAGADFENDTVNIKDNRLYQLINGADYGEHTMEIVIESGTLKAYTFTFG